MTKAQPRARSIALRLSGIALAATLLGGCLSDQSPGVRGFVLDEKALDQIRPGSSAEQVILVLGTPSTTSTVGGQTYYYISQKVSQRFQFMNEKITDQRVVAVYLDKNNRVERVANYGLKDGKVFDFISRTTPTGGVENSFISSLFRRIGAPSV
ncbi:outer membrane protein assembly factor BamE [Rhabdaerophilum sp. SD176]|uniref:outer membrane protein assembly factor BamE n=1 Tax=Rhabdaerophilum sp. SD176 TaxID=2983548 RepID=UPI0024DFC5EB|nr:outer membrane protein assembly factor BamE [Rhabdaerophilum sp. SD176]